MLVWVASQLQSGALRAAGSDVAWMVDATGWLVDACVAASFHAHSTASCSAQGCAVARQCNTYCQLHKLLTRWQEAMQERLLH